MERYEKYKPSGIEWIGEVPEHWDLKKIKFCFDVYAGATPKTENAEYWDGDIVWVTPADYKTEDKYINGGKKTITKKGYDSCNTQIVPVGSIIFSKRAPIGTVALSNVELCTNQGCLSCVPKGTNSTFYYYAMSVSTECFDLLGSGATFKEISADSFSNVKMPYPSLAEQEAIAAYLDARCADIDKVVATQEKRIALLKELKQSVITQAVTRGLNPDVKMKDSGVEWIGEVPERWEGIPLLQTAKFFIDGDWIESPDISTEGIRYITTGNIGVIQYKEQGAGYITEETFKRLNCTEVFPGDILISRLNEPIGRSCIIPDLHNRIVTSVDNVIYRPKEDLINKQFAVYQMNCYPYTMNANLLARGTTMHRISRTTLGKIKLAVPPMEEQIAIVNYLDQRCSKIDKQINAVSKQIDLLREYKQSLITEVVTGKRKVC